MSKKDLTQLSKKELESMLAKKYGVDKYLNQRSQLLGLLGSKGETDIQTGFTGPETEALSIMFSNKAEGGLVNLLGGGSVIGNSKNVKNGILDLFAGSSAEGHDEDEADEQSEHSSGEAAGPETDDSGEQGGAGDDSTGDDESDEVAERGDVFGAGPTQYGKDFTQQQIDAYTKEVSRNPQLQGFLGKKISSLIEDKNFNIERDKDGMITGVTAQTVAPGLLGAVLGPVTTYTGYGKGFDDMLGGGGDDGSDTSEMIKKIVEEKKKEEDSPLTQEQIDYYTRGMGSATKPLKTLDDVNKYMSSLVGTTESPTGAKLSKDKKFLILPNGKIINLKTGKVQDSMSGLELFAGGMI